MSAPGPPEDLTITSTTSTSIAIMWSPPADNGGAAVIAYSVMVSGGTTSTTTTSMTSMTISGLTENTMYTISVLALNSAGFGLSAEVTEVTLLSGECVIIFIAELAHLYRITSGNTMIYIFRSTSHCK